MNRNQVMAVAGVVGHLSALAAHADNVHADRQARYVRELVTAFGMEHLRQVSDVEACFASERVTA